MHVLTFRVHVSVLCLFVFSYCLWGTQGKNTEVVCNLFSIDHVVRTFHHNTSILGSLYGMTHSFTELDKAVVHVITKAVMPSNHLILCHTLLLLPSIFPNIRVFFNELALYISLPNYWNFSINTSNEYSGLISFMIDWFNLLAVQGTFECFLQHHSSKHQFFGTQPVLWPNCLQYLTTRKIIALTRWIFVSKVMSLLFNKLSSFVMGLP